MDPIIVLILVLFVAVVLILALRRNNTTPDTPGERAASDETFEFGADENLATPVRRRVQIVAHAQNVRGKLQKVRVDAMAMPMMGELPALPNKGIDEFLVAVMNPTVRVVETGEPLYEFDPPLEVTIYFNSQDMSRTTLQNDLPQLSITTGYESGEGWRFEKLPTQVQMTEQNSGTLFAKLYTLQPKDPLFATRP